jgi:hypothetical protein
MIKRWLANLGLLILISAIVAFIYLRPQPEAETQGKHEISSLKLADFTRVSIEFPAKAPVSFEKIDGYWHLTQPHNTRADQLSVQRIVSIVAATSAEKFSTENLEKFGLDQPKLKIRLDDEEFLFGTYNPVSGEQYLAYKDAVYLVATSYSEAASVQVVEMIDKYPLKPTEKVAGFDLSRLEQWEDVRLNIDLVDGTWKASAEKAKPVQDEMNEWLDTLWLKAQAKSVEPYIPNRNAVYPSLQVKLEGGGKVHFDKMQESPEMLLGRPDEGLIYHFPPDAGFAMTNPPVHISKEE